MSLSKRQQRVARMYARSLKLEDKAKTLYDRFRQLQRAIALKLKGKPVRITEEGKYLIAEDLFAEGIKADSSGEDSALWAHGAVRRWKLVTRNLD